jgi:hypothetical protein
MRGVFQVDEQDARQGLHVEEAFGLGEPPLDGLEHEMLLLAETAPEQLFQLDILADQ